MNNQSNDCCAICNQQPEDMLILACNHNLCLDCATQLFTASNHKNSTVLQCQICCLQTSLDEQTIRCLASLAYKHHRPSSILFPPLQHQLPKPPKELKGIFCKEHHEKAQYYCFNCCNPNICSQCILVNSHSNHKILTLKKASKELLSQLNGNLQQLQGQKQKLLQQIEVGVKRKQELMISYQQRQKRLKDLFDDIMKQTVSRYSQLKDNLDVVSRRSIEMIDGYLMTLGQKIETIDGVIAQGKQMIKIPDPQTILLRYNDLRFSKAQILSQPLEMPINHSSLTLQGQTKCIIQIDAILRKINWQQISTIQQKPIQQEIQINHHHQLINNQASFMAYQNKHWSKGHNIDDNYDNQLRQNNGNISLNNYSGIKGNSGLKSNSRKLQLSRSMDNATNIINKLQERIRK